MLQDEAQAAYTALQVAEDRVTSLETQLEAAPLEAAAAANHKASNSFCVCPGVCVYLGCLSICQ